MKIKRPKFQQIYIEITNICNLNCPFCLKTKRKPRQMTIDEIDSIAEKIKNYTHSVYLHVKGEPLTHNNLEEVLAVFTKHQIKVKITTNGIGIFRHADYLLNNDNITKINISLQSIQNLDDKFIDNYFDEINRFIKKNNKTYIYLRNWAMDDKQRMDLEARLKVFFPNALFENDELLSEYVHYSLADKFEWPSIMSNDIEYSKCLGGKNQLGILSDGTVTLCCLDTDGDTNLGNIFEMDLDEIINSLTYQKAVKSMPYLELCKKCSYRLRFKKT